MGRRLFREDLKLTITTPARDIGFIELTDDGEITFSYLLEPEHPQHAIRIKILALNVDEYPTGNEYMLFTNDPDADPRVLVEFQHLSTLVNGKSINIAFEHISDGLKRCLSSNHVTDPMCIDRSSHGNDGILETENTPHEVDTDDDWYGSEEDDSFSFEEHAGRDPKYANDKQGPDLSTAVQFSKIKADLRDAKEAGFRVGIIGDLMQGGIVSVAIHVTRLGISDEVMRAWHLQKEQYLVLLIRFQYGYTTIEQVSRETALTGNTEMHVGLCMTYKPSRQAAYGVFKAATPEAVENGQFKDQMQTLFIGKPLNDFIRDRFPIIVKFRDNERIHWLGAEQMVHDMQRATFSMAESTHYMKDDNNVARAFPPIVMSDSMNDKPLKECSLPLVAMQFVLRHFVRCTEFCLNCHCRVENTFESLKPYVCSRSLCLYQYMALGFGPDIECEVMSQPHVIDLLVSFCYSQAQAGRLQDFPIGINLNVPLLPQSHSVNLNAALANTHPASTYVPSSQDLKSTTLIDHWYSVMYDYHERTLVFADDQQEGKLLRKGDLIVLRKDGIGRSLHHRVVDAVFPVINLNAPIEVEDGHCRGTESSEAMPRKSFSVKCFRYNHAFDTLPSEQKQQAIIALLDTLPPVKEMRAYMESEGGRQNKRLRDWRDRINEPTLDILRWIIASNRSCILQVDRVLENGEPSSAQPVEARVSGVDNYMQFRFAQGAPDKEQRFVDCVKQHTSDPTYPTLFAWHGSPLHNWHSIIREGLHFKDVVHGRVYGNGVYMSDDIAISAGYTGGRPYVNGRTNTWPNSELKICSAVSLCEVVNNKKRFVSSHPYYVVSETDWIQTRYLFVQTSTNHTQGQEPSEIVAQDPTSSVYGSQRKPAVIPITAIPKFRRNDRQSGHSLLLKDTRKRKIKDVEQNQDLEMVEDDAASVVTNDEDRKFFLDENELNELDHDMEMNERLPSDMELDVEASPSRKKKAKHDQGEKSGRVVAGCCFDESKTDFRPGKLDMSKIKILGPPDETSTAASGALMRAFKTVLKTQESTPAHEIGWYISPEQLENMYQWIIELHSFDEEIPLAQDMKTVGITSVVVEMRFTNDFPFAPPFVRVVRPRFLPFNQGGGGHVTEGGAICMELLTNDGWSAVNSIESVLLQIRLAMSERERPARLVHPSHRGSMCGRNRDSYEVGEAIAAYERACRMHGWKVPQSFARIQRD